MIRTQSTIDFRKYKDSVIGKITLRQIFCALCSVAIALLQYFFVVVPLNIQLYNAEAGREHPYIFIMVLLSCIPFFACVEFQGQYLNSYIVHFVKFMIQKIQKKNIYLYQPSFTTEMVSENFESSHINNTNKKEETEKLEKWLAENPEFSSFLEC